MPHCASALYLENWDWTCALILRYDKQLKVSYYTTDIYGASVRFAKIANLR